MELPLGIYIDIKWIILVVAFIATPILMLLFNKIFILVLQTIIAGGISLFITFLNIQNQTITSNDAYIWIIYGGIFVYLILALYAIIESIYNAFAYQEDVA